MIERNKIPAHWKIKSISDVCEILDGLRRPVNSTERMKRINGKPENELFPYYGATGQVGLIDDYILDGEYILLGEDGAPFLDPFKDKAYLVQGKMWVNNHAHILKSRYSNKFLYYYLNNVNYKEFVSGTTRLKLNQSSLREIPVPMPPLTEQHLIVENIEELFSELEAGQRQLETVKEQLKTYRQAVLRYAFDGRITNKSKVGKEIPKDWKWSILEKVCNKIQDGSHFSPKIQYNAPGLDRFKYITAKNIRNNHLDLSNLTYVDRQFHTSIFIRCNPEYGDVLMTKDGVNTGEVTVNTLSEEFSLLSSVCLFKPNKELLNSSYLKYFIQSPFGSKIIDESMTGTAIKRIILKKLKSAKIVLPPLDTQERIVSEIDSRLSICDKLEETIYTCLQQTEVLKQSIFQRAFEGKLVKPQTN